MRKITELAVLLLLAPVCFVQSQTGEPDQQKRTMPKEAEGLVPLDQPYTISTAPHFAILVQFPKADSIRRIALGDSNYFLAEADKDDPHYAIVKQVQASGERGKPPVETNMLVYMASGRVINIMLQAGKLAETAYSIDYAVPTAQPKDPQPKDNPSPLSPEELEKKAREKERSDLIENMISEVKEHPKSQPGVRAGGLDFRFYAIKRLNEIAVVSFDVENTSSEIVDLGDPQINLITAADKTKDSKKPPAKVEPVELTQSIVSSKQLAAGARSACVVVFKPPVHDSDQQVVLSISNRAIADKPTTYRLE
jgi:hypothetical protein